MKSQAQMYKEACEADKLYAQGRCSTARPHFQDPVAYPVTQGIRNGEMLAFGGLSITNEEKTALWSTLPNPKPTLVLLREV